GGREPIWRRDGRELFFAAPGGRLMAAAVTTRGSQMEVGVPQPLFELGEAGTSALIPRQYDVSPDGERFLVVRRVSSHESSPLVLDLNWTTRGAR
ncbi:MAG TPA: hypothetical protein VLO07_09085, partial [Thermoanaerobaculia bacterium]|nr:hypothetical protein [Thermoanaerobaculia bacterium]